MLHVIWGSIDALETFSVDSFSLAIGFKAYPNTFNEIALLLLHYN